MGSGFSTGHDYTDGGRGIDQTGPTATTIHEAINRKDEVDRAYDEFADETGITERQGKTISDRRDVLEEILREDLGVEETRLIGSFTRGTMVGPLKRDSDADVMVVLDADKHRDWIEQENGARNCLRAVKRRIENDPRFARTDVEIDQNVVKVKYHDSTIEIAPAFRYSQVPHADHPRDGFNLFNDASDGYAIPDTHGGQSWTGTNPREYKQRFEARDKVHNGRVSGLTRIMKRWAKSNDVPVRSYHMEVMVYNYFAEKAKTGRPVPENYHDLSRDFVKSLPSRIQSRTKEPVYDEVVDGGVSPSQRRQAAQDAKRASENLEKAKQLKEQGRTEEAKERLQQEYGDGFRE